MTHGINFMPSFVMIVIYPRKLRITITECMNICFCVFKGLSDCLTFKN
ncbi:MAG: CRISPR-associated DxTHG motif protein [Promethearchaeota archaeon]